MSLLNLLDEFIMFEKIRKMKNKKGFTLVELIVVLVILAILAALLIPALTGYIDKANKVSTLVKFLYGAGGFIAGWLAKALANVLGM